MSNRKSQRDQVYAFIARRPSNGATRKEIEQRLGMLHQSVGPRVAELIDARLVVETGERRDRSAVLLAKRGRRS
jgi:predicted transcriptional regulator